MACLAGPVAFAAQTVTSPHTGSVPSAGPSAAGGRGGPGGFGGGAGQSQSNAALERALKTDAGRYRWVAATSGSQSAATLELATGGEPVMAIGGFSGEGGDITLSQFKQYVARGEIHYYIASGGGGGGGGAGGVPGGAGAARGDSAGTSRPAGGVASLFGDSGSRPSGSGGGGFAGRGPGGGGLGGGPGGRGASTSQITTWVKAHFKSVTIGGETVYDLTQPLT